jgi:hypothetical protein
MPTQAILPLTKQLAYAAAHDAGNRHMRAAGRTVWAVNDYNVACATFDRLWSRDRDTSPTHQES